MPDDFAAPVPLKSILPINHGLHSADETTMVSILGSPHMPLTRDCQNGHASDAVTALMTTAQVAPHVRVSGLKPAVAGIKAVLDKAFQAHPGLSDVLGTEGMLCVRMRKPTDGSISTHVSNHAWGTAIDFKLVGAAAPANTGASVPRFIAVLVPLFNAAGWFSGIAFRDTMHFEVADETIRAWSHAGMLSGH